MSVSVCLSPFFSPDTADMTYSCPVCDSGTQTPLVFGEFFFLPYSGLGVSVARLGAYYPPALWLVGVSLILAGITNTIQNQYGVAAIICGFFEL